MYQYIWIVVSMELDQERTLIHQPMSEEAGERVIKALCEDEVGERLSCHEEIKPCQYGFLGGRFKDATAGLALRRA